jgi:ABC-type multidrug transport system fused ATPase/permease subunit
LLVGVLLTLVQVGMLLAQPWPLSMLVDDVLAAPVGTVEQPIRMVALAIGALLGIVAVGALADYGATRMLSSVGQRVGNDLRQDVFAHLQRLSLRFHGRARVGDLTSRATSDSDRVQDTLVQTLAVLVPNALLVAGMVIVMFAVDPTFTLFALAGAPLLAYVVVSGTRRLKAASRRAREHGGEVASVAGETLVAIPSVQALSLETALTQRFRMASEAGLLASLDAVRAEARFSPMTDVASVLSTAVVMAAGSVRVLQGDMSLGTLLVFLAYVSSLYKPVKALARLGMLVGKGIASAERVQSILATDPEIADRTLAIPLRSRLRGHVTFEAVTFSYSGADDDAVLRDVELEVAAGETVAFVGPTGAGKSTLLSLVPRLYDPRHGRVLVDGIDVRDIQLAALRSQTAMVLQDTLLFRGSIADNIALGMAGSTRDDVARAARLALVDEFSDRLPDGLDTKVGERGVGLSGGQKQRIAIARALLRNSPILLLDEPTSALDAESESLVMEALGRLMEGRTTLVVAHRLSTVRDADRIVVVEGGRINESGTPAFLMAKGGRYARLQALQSGGAA